jgi:hypothetical protein
MARANKFAVYMTNPAGQNLFTGGGGGIGSAIGTAVRTAASGGTIDATSVLNDPRDLYLLCESCSLPGRQINTDEFRTGVKAVKMPYGVMTDEISFTFLLTNDYYIWKYFKNWMDLIVPPDENINKMKLNYKQVYQTDVIIQQMSSADFVPVQSVKLVNAFPITINAVELSNATENDAMRCTITMTYDNWEEQGLIDGMLGAVGKTISNII